MPTVKPLVFYDDTKATEAMRTNDTVTANIFRPFVQVADIIIPTNNLALFVAEYEISGTVMLSLEGTSFINID